MNSSSGRSARRLLAATAAGPAGVAIWQTVDTATAGTASTGAAVGGTTARRHRNCLPPGITPLT